jgi:hypothetical protein
MLRAALNAKNTPRHVGHAFRDAPAAELAVSQYRCESFIYTSAETLSGCSSFERGFRASRGSRSLPAVSPGGIARLERRRDTGTMTDTGMYAADYLKIGPCEPDWL